jgi:hypothetical protein
MIYIVDCEFEGSYLHIVIDERNEFLLGHKGKSILREGPCDYVTDIFFVEDYVRFRYI